LLDDAGGLAWVHGDETEVLFGAETGEGFRRVAGRGDRLDEELGDLFGCLGAYFAIDADDAAEGGYRVSGERELVCLNDGFADCGSAGVGVLDDGDGGLVEFLDEFPAGVKIDEVVVAELLALELPSARDSGAALLVV
jgi:hypothetical protein